MDIKESLAKEIMDLVSKNKALSTIDLTYFLIGKYEETDIHNVTDNLIKEKKLGVTPSKGELLVHKIGKENIIPPRKTETERYLDIKAKKTKTKGDKE